MSEPVSDTMIEIDRWPGIRAVALLIAYDNGMINRQSPEKAWLESLSPRLYLVSDFDLGVLDAWCLALSDSDRETFASGEFEAMVQVALTCPRPELTNLFDGIFDTMFEAG